MDPHTTLDPQQVQQLIDAIQVLSFKLDSLSSTNVDTTVKQLVDHVFDQMITYHLLTR